MGVSGYSRRSRFLGGNYLSCVCVVVSVGVLVFVGYTMTCFWWVFVVAVFVLVFCFVVVVCLVWCVACLVVVFAGFLPVSVLWVMPCVVLCRYPRFVFACRRFLRWVSAFGGCTMSSFVCMFAFSWCMSAFLCLGVCFLYVYNDCFYGYVAVSVFRCLTLVCV